VGAIDLNGSFIVFRVSLERSGDAPGRLWGRVTSIPDDVLWHCHRRAIKGSACRNRYHTTHFINPPYNHSLSYHNHGKDQQSHLQARLPIHGGVYRHRRLGGGAFPRLSRSIAPAELYRACSTKTGNKHRRMHPKTVCILSAIALDRVIDSRLDASSVVTRGSIGLANVVDSYNIFVSTQGAQGVLGEASRQQLATVFEKELEAGLPDDSFKNDKWKRAAAVEVILPIILDKGREQGTGGVASNAFTGSNPSRGNDNTR